MGLRLPKLAGLPCRRAPGPQIWLNVIGRTAVRFNTPSIFTVSYGNSGDTDAIATPIFISVPNGATVTLLSPELQLPSTTLFDPNQLPTSLQINGATVIPIMIPRIAAGSGGSVQIELTLPDTSSTFEIDAYNWAPFAESLAELTAADQPTAMATRLSGMVAPRFIRPRGIDSNAATACLNDLIQLGLTIGAGIDPVAGCATAAAGFLSSTIMGVVSGSEPGSGENLGYNVGGIIASGGQLILKCGQTAIGSTPVGLALNTALAIAGAGLQGAQAAKDCGMVAKPDNPQGKKGGGVQAIDPNYKSGPLGDGSTAQFLGAGKALSYAVGFENEPTATAPASQVVVTDQLDPTKVDLTTLSLGAISFGTNVINLPPNTTTYSTTYTLSSTLNVRIAASLDTASGSLKWTFTSIDPSTGQPPTDPTVGFLPPDTDGIVGQGSVIFSVMPKAGLTTGAAVSNTASVVFDTNAAIQTQTWTNTLDVDAPHSSVTALPATIPAGAFTVSWSGTDVGSGIANYDIFVSDNGGAYTAFQTNVSTTSASFTGVAGHTYAFYSMATDGAGNVETAKTAADTTTQVVNPIVMVASATTLTASTTSAGTGSSVTLSVQVAPPAGTVTVPTGTVTFLNGAVTLGTATLDGTAKASFTTTALPAGTNSVTASYGGDGSFTPSVSAVVTITVGTPAIQVSLSPATLTLASGNSGSTTVTVASAFGFSSATTFTCSGLPANAACSFSPASVMPASDGTVSTMLTITTVSRSAMLALPQEGGGSRIAYGLLFPVLLSPLALIGRRRKTGLAACGRLLLIVCATALFLVASGCGGSSPNTTTASPTGTPAGTSSVTVTASSGTVTQTASLQLTVQ